MGVRKAIGCLIANPEAAYQQRLLKGIQAQVARYGYDLYVFTPLVGLGTPQKDYVNSDLNILNLINFDLVEGVLVCGRTFLVNNDYSLIKNISGMLKKKCRKPVFVVDFDIEGFETIHTEKKSVFQNIADYVFNSKKCKTAIFMTGTNEPEKKHPVYKAIVNQAKKYGIKKEDIRLVYGDFWYTSGKVLAEKFVKGEEKIPDVVICENDYMALGLENELRKHGINCPKDLMITGYEAAQDAFLNEVTITSYEPKEERTAMECVNALIHKISPESKIFKPKPQFEQGLIPAASTGDFIENIEVYRRTVKDWIYKVNRSEEEWHTREFFDIGRLMESYMFEHLTEKNSPIDCLYRIFIDAYLLEPYSAFYLNLCPDWLDTTKVHQSGYPSEMISAIDKISKQHPNYRPGVNRYSLDPKYTFKTKKLLPEALGKDWAKPQVFYFVPIHFGKNTLGYAVLQFDLDRLLIPTVMHRNWLRNVQNGLEMIRTKNKLYSQNLVDGLTGVFNRKKFGELCSEGTKTLINDNVGIMMLDIDFFKVVNDTYGHAAGDEVLKRITLLAKKCIRESDIIIRWGGEEFVIFCLGCTDENRLHVIAEKIRKTIEADESMATKVTVSIGVSVYDGENYEASVAMADKALYYAKMNGRNQVVIHSRK